MKSIRKFFLVFFCCFFGTLIVSASSDVPFQDINNHIAEDSIIELAEQGYLTTENADGTPRTNFYPNNTLTRAELTKLALTVLADISIPHIENPDLPFSDVNLDDWYYSYISSAWENSIISGVTATEFEPNRPVSKAEALKIILETSEIGLITTSGIEYSDISEYDWYYPYINTAADLCTLPASDATYFNPNDPILRGEAVFIMYQIQRLKNGEKLCEIEEEEEQQQQENDDDEIASKNSVSVSLSPDSPGTRTIPANATNVPFLVFDITAPENEDLLLTFVTISHSGLGDARNIERVKVLVGFQSYGNSRGFTNDERIAPLNLEYDPLTIPAGTTVSVTIAADMDAENAGGEHRFSIDSPEDITLIGKNSETEYEIEGDFPLGGDTMSARNIATGALEVKIDAPRKDHYYIGEDRVELARIIFEEISGEKDVVILGFRLEFNGIDDGDIIDLFAEKQGHQISDSYTQIEDGFGYFSFGGGLNLEKGDRETIRIRGDIVDGVKSSLRVQFDDVEDDIFTIQRY